MFAVCNIDKSRERFAAQFSRQLFQTAVIQLSEFVGIFECHLRCTDGIVHGSLYNDSFRIGKRGFKGNVVCCFYDAFIGEKLCKELVKSFAVYIFADTVSQGNINAGTFLNGKRTADDPRRLYCSGYGTQGIDRRSL